MFPPLAPAPSSATVDWAALPVQPSETMGLVMSLWDFPSDILVTPKQKQWRQLQTGLTPETKSFGSSGTDPGSGGAAVKSHEPASFQAPTAEVWMVLIVFREPAVG